MAIQTKVITNFNGMLTRIESGDLDSGFAKFNTSWGYDPFSKQGDLTWNYQTSVIGSVTGMVLDGVKTANPYFYCIDTSGKFYVMTDTRRTTLISGDTFYGTKPLDDQVVSVLGSFASILSTFTYGASIEIVQGSNFLVSSDNTIMHINMANDLLVSSQASVFGNASSVTSGIPHPLITYQGKVYYGNGNNIGVIDPSIGTHGTITDGTVLSPALPGGLTVTDLDTTPEGDYMLITGSQASPPAFGNPFVPFAAGTLANYAAESFVFYWNGTDEGVTAVRNLPAFPAPALSTFLDQQYTVMQDTFGMGLMQGNQKLLTLPNNLNPAPNALNPNGTFLTWMSVEGIGEVNATSSVYSSVAASLYYYGKQDEQSPTGLWRLLRIHPDGSQVMIYTPFNGVINNFSAFSNLVLSFGKHYLSTREADNDHTFNNIENKFHRFVLNPAQNTSPVLGVYETQTQLFSKRISIKEIRVYTEPVATGNGFQLDMIGAGGTPISNGTFTYVFGDPVDNTERINFNPTTATTYSLGVRITNTGTTNMTIKKIEVDFTESGK